jgi:hypothetical protein
VGGAPASFETLAELQAPAETTAPSRPKPANRAAETNILVNMVSRANT